MQINFKQMHIKIGMCADIGICSFDSIKYSYTWSAWAIKGISLQTTFTGKCSILLLIGWSRFSVLEYLDFFRIAKRPMLKSAGNTKVRVNTEQSPVQWTRWGKFSWRKMTLMGLFFVCLFLFFNRFTLSPFFWAKWKKKIAKVFNFRPIA